ncbi:nickel pincer cofactor biosynthesis protein LarC [Butyribacter sp.]|uniref:nickel pincer cofactor biosynthesis protein LarC n=1 Tax=Butyribacter sp. TaxID=2822465 RepID=UPI002A931390|nr:nickel pincer cofactor biosynthesis protein LarC [Butyribacter sp.]
MKQLYLDLGMGAAGDMLTAALLELCPHKDGIIKKLNSLNIPGVHYEREIMKKSGICGTHMHVIVNGSEEECGHEHEEGHHEHSHHHHISMSDIGEIVSKLNTSEKIKKQILDVYNIIADAESRVHGETVSQIHFHEVGNMDAIADVAAVCILINELNIGKIVVSPVHTGSGFVMCAHGKLPVPAPATALILEGVPYYSDGLKGELCTPTGAALIKYFADDFSDMPAMVVEKTGYGFGKKEFERLNCVRALLGTAFQCSEVTSECDNSCEKTDKVVELACNIDDMTAEEIGFATEKILEAGALDVYTISAYMKKNRPGTVICCLCHEDEREKFAKLMFKYTTTIGVRQYNCDRYILSRKIENIETDYGNVRVKKTSGYGVEREKMEYDDLSNIANKRQKSVFEVKHDIKH